MEYEIISLISGIVSILSPMNPSTINYISSKLGLRPDKIAVKIAHSLNIDESVMRQFFDNNEIKSAVKSFRENCPVDEKNLYKKFCEIASSEITFDEFKGMWKKIESEIMTKLSPQEYKLLLFGKISDLEKGLSLESEKTRELITDESEKTRELITDESEKTRINIIDNTKQKKLTKSLGEQFNALKNKIWGDYENPPEYPNFSIIKNFTKFDGQRLFVNQRCLNLEDNNEESNVSVYLTKLIDKFLSELNEHDKLKDKIIPLRKELSKLKLQLPPGSFKEKQRLISKITYLEKEIFTKESQLSNLKREKIIPIVGDYGSGKSALCHRTLYNICRINNDDLIPIFIPLGELKKHEDDNNRLIDDMFDYITNEYSIDISNSDFHKELEKGRFVFILDGLDEMATKLNDVKAQKHLEHVISLAKTNVVVVTSRYTYMTTKMQTRLLLNYQRLIKILDFSEPEKQTFLNNFSPDDMEKRDAIESVISKPIIKDLVSKPLFLHVVCKNYNNINAEIILNDAVILKMFTDEWIRHDVMSKKSNLSDKSKQDLIDERQRISEILALTEYEKMTPIGMSDIMAQVNDEFKIGRSVARNKVEQYYRDGRDSTFLVPEENGKFRCILKPIKEYLIARRIISDVIRKDSKHLLEHSQIIKNVEVFNLIKDIISAEWLANPIFVEKLRHDGKMDDDSIQALTDFQNHSDFIFKTISGTKNEYYRHNVSNLLRILCMTNNLPPNSDLSNLNLKNLFLHSIDLAHSNFSNSDLTEADLRGVDLSNSDLSGCNLTNSNLTGVNFTNADLSNTNLSHTKLVGTQIDFAMLINTDFSFSDLSFSTFEGVKFDAVKLDSSSLMCTEINEVSFSNTSLKNINFSKSTLKNINLSNKDLSGIDFTFATLEKINLSNSDLYNSNLTSAKLISANLSNSKLRNSNLTNTNLSNADLTNVDFTNATIIETVFSDTKMDDKNLRNIDFSRVHFYPIPKSELQKINSTVSD